MTISKLKHLAYHSILLLTVSRISYSSVQKQELSKLPHTVEVSQWYPLTRHQDTIKVECGNHILLMGVNRRFLNGFNSKSSSSNGNFVNGFTVKCFQNHVPPSPLIDCPLIGWFIMHYLCLLVNSLPRPDPARLCVCMCLLHD